MGNNYKTEYTLEFNRRRKSMSVIAVDERTGERRLYCKGAAENIATRCNRYMSHAGEAPMTEDLRQAINAQLTNYAKRGLRCLAMAEKPYSQSKYLPSNPDHHEYIEQDM